MERKPSGWRWALYASILCLMAGVIVASIAESEGLRKAGTCVFIVAAALYAAARIAMLRQGRPR